MGSVSLFGALHVGISGLSISRLATNLINHNIANANTPGYSRQSMAIAELRPLSTTFGSVGRGVTVTSIDRSTSRFLEAQMFQQRALFGSYDSIDQSLQSIEQILGSTENDRIGDAMNHFFDAFSDLASDPGSRSLRSSVVAQSRNLSLVFNDIASGLDRLARESRTQLDEDVSQINSLAARISALNTEIVAAKSSAGLPNDLVDQRNQLVAELSSIAQLQVHEREDGSLDLSIAGRNLVTRGIRNEIRAVHQSQGGNSFTSRVLLGASDELPVDVLQGELAGRLRMVNEIIPSTVDRIDQLAADFVARVNAVHREGMTPLGSGIDLFVGDRAGNIALSAAVDGDVDLVATGTSGAEGDGTIADRISNLRDDVAPGQSSSLTERYLEMLVDVATDRGSYRTLRDGQGAILESVTQRLESIRGVNLDEEMANLIQYQRSFEANARVISVVDEMLDTLINGMI